MDASPPPQGKPLPLMVPTIMCEAILKEDFTSGDRLYAKGEIIPMAFGQAIHLKSLGVIGAIKDETEKNLEATEALGIYGADCWFPHRLQTISRVADYLAQQGLQTNTVN